MSFSAFLKSIREIAGLTQEQAAEQINVSITTIQNWENGKYKPDLANLSSISGVYNVDMKILGDKLLKTLDNRISTTNSQQFPHYELFPQFVQDILDNDTFQCLSLTKESQDVFLTIVLQGKYNVFHPDRSESSFNLSDLLQITDNRVQLLKILKQIKILFKSSSDHSFDGLSLLGEFVLEWILSHDEYVVFTPSKLKDEYILEFLSLYPNEELATFSKDLSCLSNTLEDYPDGLPLDFAYKGFDKIQRYAGFSSRYSNYKDCGTSKWRTTPSYWINGTFSKKENYEILCENHIDAFLYDEFNKQLDIKATCAARTLVNKFADCFIVKEQDVDNPYYIIDKEIYEKKLALQQQTGEDMQTLVPVEPLTIEVAQPTPKLLDLLAFYEKVKND